MYIYRKGRSVFVKQNKIPQILLPCTPLTSAGHLAEVTENMALPVAPPHVEELGKDVTDSFESLKKHGT